MNPAVVGRWLTLQAVQDGEQVEQGHLGWPPSEEGHGPGESEQKGETGHAPQVLQQAALHPRRLARAHFLHLQ